MTDFLPDDAPAHLKVIEALNRAWAIFGRKGRCYIGVRGTYTTRDLSQANGVCGMELVLAEQGATKAGGEIEVIYHVGPLDGEPL